MIVKYKHISKKKSINKLLLRFKPEGSYLYKVYKLVVIKKKTRAKNGKYLEKIGIYNPIFNDRYLYFDTTKLYFWIELGLIIHYKVKNVLLKFFISNNIT